MPEWQTNINPRGIAALQGALDELRERLETDARTRLGRLQKTADLAATALTSKERKKLVLRRLDPQRRYAT